MRLFYISQLLSPPSGKFHLEVEYLKAVIKCGRGWRGGGWEDWPSVRCSSSCRRSVSPPPTT